MRHKRAPPAPPPAPQAVSVQPRCAAAPLVVENRVRVSGPGGGRRRRRATPGRCCCPLLLPCLPGAPWRACWGPGNQAFCLRAPPAATCRLLPPAARMHGVGCRRRHAAASLCSLLLHSALAAAARRRRPCTPALAQIRFTRMGRKKLPFYRIVAVDSRVRRDGAPLEYLGW